MKIPSVAHVSIDGVMLDVTFTFFPARRGARDSLGGKAGAGPALEPDEEAEIIIDSITSSEDIYDLLTIKQINKIEEKILEDGENE